MLTTIVTAILSLLGLLWLVFEIGTNSYVRTRAEKSPESWTYLFISAFDQIMAATVFRPVNTVVRNTSPSSSNSGQSGLVPISSLHDSLGIETGISIRNSFSVSIDISGRIPSRVWRVYSLGTMIAILGGFFALVGISLSVSFGQIQSTAFILFVSALLFFGAGMSLVALSSSPTNFFGSVNALNRIRWAIIHIDKNLIHIVSGWTRVAVKNNAEVEFAHSDKGLMSALRVKFRNTDDYITIFAYPKFFEQYILSDHQLRVLAGKLNALVEQSRVETKIPKTSE